jgi:hypothetical protein
MDTVKETFGTFQKSDRRPKLFAKLVDYLEALRRADCGQHLIIDGSFVMKWVDEPDDIDLILVLPVGWDLQADLRPYQYNLVSKKMVRTAFGFTVLTVEAGSLDEAKWTSFFGQVNTKWSTHFGWPDDLRKGILRVIP